MITDKPKFKQIIASCIVIFIFSISCSVRAITLSPSVVEVEVRPGEVAQTDIVIYNGSQRKQQVTPKVAAWAQQTTSDAEVNPSTWLTFEDEVFVISPKEKIRKKLTISAPAEFIGEKKAYLFFLVLSERSSIATNMGLPVYMMSDQAQVVSMNLVDFSIVHDDELQQSNTQLVFENKGNIHIRPDVYLRMKHADTGEYVENQSGHSRFEVAKDWPVFPDTSRVLKRSLKQLALTVPGTYIAELDIRYRYLFKEIDRVQKTIKVVL